MSNTPFDITKCRRDEKGFLHAQTRDGREVVIFTADAGGEYPIVGRIREAINPMAWAKRGQICYGALSLHSLDLVNKPEEFIVTVFLMNKYNQIVEGVHRNNCDVEFLQNKYPGWSILSRRVITLKDGEGL